MDPANDGQPIYREQSETSSPQDAVEEDDAEDTSEAQPGSKEFAFERDLRNYLSKNLTSIEPGLKIFQEEEFSGIEYPVGGRYIDILAMDAKGDYVVVELKVSRGYERAVGQILRYMAWVKKHLASGHRVRGIIVANEVTEDLRLAASLIPDLQLFEYSISMKLKPAGQ
ncbi:endonuclease NucS [Bradyrhizobium xenonodulans]|uniref:Endonuclease NucS n=1 Tax=Bradyrhizobium xenonodulans TaxID=2736875 RepID=A0ABY7MK51_9BRAD|nr:endonuclease NucS domain-containing protein [Bradyrhizobium xenonodulans]WBL78786.1 endonuclease NucS [Bradyrhizobium xenonodulans]